MEVPKDYFSRILKDSLLFFFFFFFFLSLLPLGVASLIWKDPPRCTA